MRKGIDIIEAMLGVNKLAEAIERSHGDEKVAKRIEFPSWVVTEYNSGRLLVQCRAPWDFDMAAEQVRSAP